MFAQNAANAPRLTAPLLQASQEAEEVILAAQPSSPFLKIPETQPTQEEDVIVVGGFQASQLTKKTPAARRRAPAKKQFSGVQSGLMPSIRRRPSGCEGAELDGAQSTPRGTGSAVPQSSNPSRHHTKPSTASSAASAELERWRRPRGPRESGSQPGEMHCMSRYARGERFGQPGASNPA